MKEPRPLALDDMPRHFLHDTCLRCGQHYEDGERTVIVLGGPTAKYLEVGLCICRGCLGPKSFDRPVASTTYRVVAPGVAPTWPLYVGLTGIAGAARVTLLSNGAFRVGLHRGHVEVWSDEEVRGLGFAVPVGAMAYSPNYMLYGPVEIIRGGFVEVERRFVDLSKPTVPRMIRWGGFVEGT